MESEGRLVDRMRGRLEAGSWPRVHCVLLVTLASGAAFLLSVVLLNLHVDHMAVRYGLAATGGYLAFLLLIRAWVRWKWSHLDADVPGEAIDAAVDLPVSLPSRGGDAGAAIFRGGRSGGGGASADWGSPRAVAMTSSARSGPSGKGGFSLDLDADDLVWLLVALAAALAGLTAIAYVVYVAPTLLAEAVVNALIAGKVCRGMQKRESRHWTIDVMKRTAVPAVVLIVSVVVVGYALQRVAPEARSIGGVIQHFGR